MNKQYIQKSYELIMAHKFHICMCVCINTYYTDIIDYRYEVNEIHNTQNINGSIN